MMMKIDTSSAKPKPILLVASEAGERANLRAALDAAVLDYNEAETALAAHECVAHQPPQIIICETELSDGSGFALVRSLRNDASLPEKPLIILISRSSKESDKILGFECGADDFVTKPFYPRELASRVRVLLRSRFRSIKAAGGRTAPTSRNILIDPDQRTVWIGGDPILLTLREISIFAALGRGEGRVLSRSDLLARVCLPSDHPKDRTIDAHIKGLRKKLGHAQSCIETVRGSGYRYSGSPELKIRGCTET